MGADTMIRDPRGISGRINGTNTAEPMWGGPPPQQPPGPGPHHHVAPTGPPPGPPAPPSKMVPPGPTSGKYLVCIILSKCLICTAMLIRVGIIFSIFFDTLYKLAKGFTESWFRTMGLPLPIL